MVHSVEGFLQVNTYAYSTVMIIQIIKNIISYVN